MVEEAQDPTAKKSQTPDDQNKTTTERVEKQTVEVGEDGPEKVTKQDSFVTGTVSPAKEG